MRALHSTHGQKWAAAFKGMAQAVPDLAWHLKMRKDVHLPAAAEPESEWLAQMPHI